MNDLLITNARVYTANPYNLRAEAIERDNVDTLTEVLDGYTPAAAYAEFQEDVKGQLKPGMLADVVRMDCDIFEKDSLEIINVRPQMTICDGKIVFEK